MVSTIHSRNYIRGIHLNILSKLKRHLPLVSLNLLLMFLFLAHVASHKEQSLRVKFIDQMENLAYDTRVLLSIKKNDLSPSQVSLLII